MRKRIFAVVLGLMVVVAFIGVVGLVCDPSERLAKAKFSRIEVGMTRKQVWQLMRDIPEQDSTMGNSLDVWDIGGWTIYVEFGPDYFVAPGTVDKLDPNGDRWKVQQKFLLPLSRPSILRRWVGRLGEFLS